MTPVRQLGVSLLVCVLVSLCPQRAHADDEGRLTVALAIDPCAKVDVANVRRVFLIELRTSVPKASLGDASQGARIQVACDGALILLQISDQVTGKSVARRIDLSRTPAEGRDRLLALAVMELLVASWAELRTTPKPVVTPVDRKAAPATRRSARALASRNIVDNPWTTTASALGSLTWESYGFAGGGGVRVVREHRSGVGWAVELSARTANENVALGSVSVRTVSAGASAVGVRVRGDLSLRAGVGVRLGMVTMSGTPDDQAMAEGGQIVGLSAGPLLGAGADLRVYRDLVLGVSVETGLHLFPVRGLVDDSRAVDLEGAWLITRLAAGWRW